MNKNSSGWVGRWPYSFYGLMHLDHFKTQILFRDLQNRHFLQKLFSTRSSNPLSPLNTCLYFSLIKVLLQWWPFTPLLGQCLKFNSFCMASPTKWVKFLLSISYLLIISQFSYITSPLLRNSYSPLFHHSLNTFPYFLKTFWTLSQYIFSTLHFLNTFATLFQPFVNTFLVLSWHFFKTFFTVPQCFLNTFTPLSHHFCNT